MSLDVSGTVWIRRNAILNKVVEKSDNVVPQDEHYENVNIELVMCNDASCLFLCLQTTSGSIE